MVSTRAEIITRRTYCRPLDEAGTQFETWPQVIARVISHQRWLWERAKGSSLSKENENELEELRALMLSRRALVAGRTLWLGGTEIVRRRESSNFNCSFQKVNTVHDLVDSLWLLEQGCGLGSRPVKGTLNGFAQVIPEIEFIRSTRSPQDKGRPTNIERWSPDSGVWSIQVGDSAEAWAKAVGKLFAGKFPARKLVWDTSQIRGAGGRLSGYGWISQGDALLVRAVDAIYHILNRRAGQLLQAIDILDVLDWFGTILATRRSAEIILYPYLGAEWESFARAKHNYWLGNLQRAQSNNSLLFFEKPSKKALTSIFDTIIEMGGSDPGLYNASAALVRAPWFKGTNPSLRAGTKVVTREGILPIESLQDKTFEVITDAGNWASAKCFLSGKNKKLWKLSFQTGLEVYATAEHKWPLLINGRTVKVRTDELKAGDYLPLRQTDNLGGSNEGTFDDGFLLGYIFGDGWVSGEDRVGLIISQKQRALLEPYLKKLLTERGCDANFRWEETSGEFTTTNKKLYAWISKHGWYKKEKLPEAVWTFSEDFRRGFVSGLFSADGHRDEQRKTFSLATMRVGVAEEVTELLNLYGIKAFKTSRHYNTNLKGHHYEGTCYDVKLSLSHSLEHFLKLFKVLDWKNFDRKSSKKNTLQVCLTSVEETDLKEDVWDISVNDSTHTFKIAACTTGNCGEILLGDKSFCNLVEVDLGSFANSPERELHRAMWIIARANYRQTCVNLDDSILQRAWHENNEYLRLCGVGLTGIVRYPHLTPYTLRVLRGYATAGAYSMADELNMPRPKNITTVKPSGTLSKIMDTTEGIHKPLGRYIFNNINFGEHDPLLVPLQAAGYNIFTNPTDASGRIVTFPVEWSDIPFDKAGSREVNLESAVQQLERYKLLMDNYVDHNASITVSYDISERRDIVDWLDRNWDTYVGVSFLFRNDPTKSAADLGHPYLPQEVVDKAKFDEYNSRLKPVKVADTQGEDLIDEACAGGACPIR